MKGPLILGMVIFLSCGFLPCSSEDTTPKPEDTTPDNDPICYEDGECLNSNLIDVTYPNTTAKCLEDCKNTAGCQWVTYKRHKYDPPQPTFCQLFENCGYFNEECRENCTTSHVSCPVQQCNILGRCEGLLLQSLRAYSARSCLGYCSEYNCTWFSYSAATDSCLLFSTCPTIEEDHQEDEYYAYHTFEASCNEMQAVESLRLPFE